MVGKIYGKDRPTFQPGVKRCRSDGWWERWWWRRWNITREIR